MKEDPPWENNGFFSANQCEIRGGRPAQKENAVAFTSGRRSRRRSSSLASPAPPVAVSDGDRRPSAGGVATTFMAGTFLS